LPLAFPDHVLEREATRKKYIASLESRTPEQLAEEEALYVEIKRLEQNERKFKRDRENLLRTIAGIESGLPDIPDDDGIQLGIITDGLKKKKKGGLLELESPATPSTATTAIPPIKQRPQPKASTAFGMDTPVAHEIFLTAIQMPNTALPEQSYPTPALPPKQRTNPLSYVPINCPFLNLRFFPRSLRLSPSWVSPTAVS